MKMVRGIFIAILLIMPSLSCIAEAFDGPLQVKNLFPLFLHAGQPYLEKAEQESSMSYSLSHSSTYMVGQSDRWDIGLDMEITELNFRYKRIVKDLFEIGMDIPVLATGSGVMDGFLESYHDAFGFPDYGRSDRPDNEFLYEVNRDSETVIKGSSRVRLGDIRVGIKKALLSSGGLTLSIRGEVELPVSSAQRGFSNGSIDTGAALLLDGRITDSVMTYWNIGAAFPGDVKGHETIDLKDYVYGGAAVEAQVSTSVSLLAQVMGQTAVYPETGIPEVDRDAWMVAFGGRYSSGQRVFELSLTEDINTSGAPDFIVNLTYKFSL